jgi:hypothetical protein
VGFLGWRKPKWKNADADVRLAGINEMTWEHQAVFAQLALGDPDARVRAAAARRVNEQARLETLLTSADAEVAKLARERLATVAVQLARSRSLAASQALLTTINDQKSLAELTLEAQDAGVRRAAFARLLAQAEPSPAMLALVSVQDAQGEFALQAVARLDKRNLLKDVTRKAKVESIRAAAAARLRELESQAAKPSPEQSRKARRKALEPLVGEATRWALSTDFTRAAAELESIQAKRNAILGDYAEVPLDDEAQAASDRIDRARRELSRRREEAVAQAAAAVTAREAFLAELATRQPVTDGDANAERVRLDLRWQALPPIDGPERAQFAARFAAESARLFPAAMPVAVSSEVAPVATVPEAVLAELAALVGEAETVATAGNRLEARDRFRILHKRWNHLIADLPPGHELRTRFLDAYGRFKEAGRAARAEREERTKERLVELAKLAAEAEALAGSPPAEHERQARFAQLKDLQARWKVVGPVRPDLVAPVRERFRSACDTAFAPLKALIEAEDWARFANLGNAEALIAEVEALTGVEDLAQVAGTIKRIQAAWKDLGPLPGDRREATWQRYKAACDAVYARLKPYYAELDVQRLVNL